MIISSGEFQIFSLESPHQSKCFSIQVDCIICYRRGLDNAAKLTAGLTVRILVEDLDCLIACFQCSSLVQKQCYEVESKDTVTFN